MAQHGESRDYYEQQAPPQGYTQQPPKYDQSYGMQQQQQQQNWAAYGGGNNNYGAPNNAAYEGGKPFEQQFKVERPKWNDVSVARRTWNCLCSTAVVETGSSEVQVRDATRDADHIVVDLGGNSPHLGLWRIRCDFCIYSARICQP